MSTVPEYCHMFCFIGSSQQLCEVDVVVAFPVRKLEHRETSASPELYNVAMVEVNLESSSLESTSQGYSSSLGEKIRPNLFSPLELHENPSQQQAESLEEIHIHVCTAKGTRFLGTPWFHTAPVRSENH